MGRNKNSVSVIIPVYNGEKTIGKCVESVLAQSFKEYEIIVVDNNSEDRTKKIIENFAEKNKKVSYVFESRRGRSFARNKGAQIAKGSILVFFDSDRVADGRDWLLNLVKPIIESKAIATQGMVSYKPNTFWANQEYLDMLRHIKKSKGNFINSANFAIKKDVFFDAGMFDPHFIRAEDTELRIRLKKRRIRIFPADESVSTAFEHRTFLSFAKRTIQQSFWEKKVYFKHKKFLKENPDPFEIKLIKFKIPSFFKLVDGSSFFKLVDGIFRRIGAVLAYADELLR